MFPNTSPFHSACRHLLVHSYMPIYTDTQHSLKGSCCKFPFISNTFIIIFSDFSSVKSKTVYLRNKDPYCHFWQIREQHLNLRFHNQHKKFWFRELPVLLNFRDYILLCLFSRTLKIKFGKAYAAVAGTVLALHWRLSATVLSRLLLIKKFPE